MKRPNVRAGMPGAPTHRDWPVILRDARARGLRLGELAKEQGVSPACVCIRTQHYGIFLDGQYSKGSAR